MKPLGALIMVLMMLTGVSSIVWAQGESTVIFLMINPGARQGGLGEAGTAIPDDASAVYWNPAGLAFQYEDPEVDTKGDATFMHVNWLPGFNLSDLHYDYLAGRYYFAGIGSVGGSIQFINYGENIHTDTKGRELDRFNSNEVALTGSYGLKLTQNMGIGVNLKFVYSRLSPVKVELEQGKGVGATFAVDAGWLYRPNFNKRLSLGANLANLGPKVAYIDFSQADPIPTTLRLGMAYNLVASEFNTLTMVYDLNRSLVPKDPDARKENFLTYFYSSWQEGSFWERFDHAVGLEYLYTDLIALRSGFFYEDPKYGARKFWTFGGGVQIPFLAIDFSYIIADKKDHPLSKTMRFSLSTKF